MTNPEAPFPDESYFERLRHADAATIEALYTGFRKPVIRAVETAGGSSADGATFFRVAVIHASFLVRDLKLDETTPVSHVLKNLAVAHFHDWAKEKNLELPPMPPVSEEEAAHTFEIPGAEARQEFRQCIRARRQFSRLDNGCQKTLLELAKDAAAGISDSRLKGNACLEKYRQNLGITEQTWSEGLPSWVITALTDDHFQKAWSAAEAVESRLAMGQAPVGGPESKVTRNVLIVLGLVLLGFSLWSYFRPPASPKVVYDENFKPPASIMADREARFAHDSVPVARVEACEQLFTEADVAYKAKDYTEAASILYTMIGEETEDCNSDALFYLGIIGLQLNEPEITVDCLAKIPDLDRFGEDLYWYQALAFVKIAAQNPMRSGIARRAVERARSNTEIPERRAQAEKMLEQLAE